MTPHRLLLTLTAVCALLVAATPAEAAPLTVCSPNVVAQACVSHSPYQGSLYCEKAWSSGGGSTHASSSAPAGTETWTSVSYWCFNYSNYGENVYQTSSVSAWAETLGLDAGVGFVGYYDTYYTSGGGPFYRESCAVWYFHPAESFEWVDCPAWVPAPWGTVLTPAFQNYASVNADCTSGSAPTAQVCWRGNPSAYVLGVSTCDGSGETHVRSLGTTVESWQAGLAACLVFKGLLGP